MAAGAITSIGTLFQYGDGGGPEVFTSLGRITNVAMDGGEVAMDDTTDLSDIYMTRIATTIDEGRVTLDMVFDPGDTGIAAMYTDRNARTRRNYKIVYSDTSENAFPGYVISISEEAPSGQALRASINIQIDGAVTRTPA